MSCNLCSNGHRSYHDLIILFLIISLTDRVLKNEHNCSNVVFLFGGKEIGPTSEAMTLIYDLYFLHHQLMPCALDTSTLVESYNRMKHLLFNEHFGS